MNRILRTMLALTLGLLLVSCSTVVFGSQDAQTPPPDNTKMNKRDREAEKPTAGSQKENSADREITRKIRRAITSDKSLSTYSRNVKVITQNGMVTLRGPVPSEDAKRNIEAKAVEVAGQDKVKDELQVVEKKSKRKGNRRT